MVMAPILGVVLLTLTLHLAQKTAHLHGIMTKTMLLESPEIAPASAAGGATVGAPQRRLQYDAVAEAQPSVGKERLLNLRREAPNVASDRHQL